MESHLHTDMQNNSVAKRQRWPL